MYNSNVYALQFQSKTSGRGVCNRVPFNDQWKLPKGVRHFRVQFMQCDD